MKGIIFSEFLELVEETFGMEVCEQMLEQSGDEGIYTSVGTYDHKLLVKLIMTLSKLTDTPPETLQEVFGESIFISLFNSMPSLNGTTNSTFDFIEKVEEYIHIEVKKLYPDSNPPQFKFISVTDAEMIMDYLSVRCMSHVCLGLIKGCAKHFNETVSIEMQPVKSDHSQVRFTLTRV